MEWEYKYTKVIGFPHILNLMIKLKPELRGIFSGLKINADAVDNVTAIFSDALTPDQHDLLNVTIDSYSDTHELVIRDGIEHNVMNPAMQFGMTFLAQFSANNVYRGKTATQINTLLATYPDLIHAAITGSLNSLYAVISSMVADTNITQEEIDEFKARLEIYLGIV